MASASPTKKMEPIASLWHDFRDVVNREKVCPKERINTRTPKRIIDINSTMNQDVIYHILSFLPRHQRYLGSFVSRQWRSICKQLENEEIRDWLSHLNAIHAFRTEQRAALMEERQDGGARLRHFDRTLSSRLHDALVHESPPNAGFTVIVSMLDRGVICSHQHTLSHFDLFHSYIMESIYTDHFKWTQGWSPPQTEFDIQADLLRILTELIASPCTSWRFSGRGGNRCVPFPYFLLQYVLFGRIHTLKKMDIFWVEEETHQITSFEQRWEAWKVFRGMAHMAKSHETDLVDWGDFCKDCVFTFCYQERITDLQQLGRMDRYFITLFLDFMLPIAPHVVAIIFDTHGKNEQLYLLFHSHFCRLPPAIQPEWEKIIQMYLKRFSKTNRHRTHLHHALESSRNLRLLVIEQFLKPFCARNDTLVVEILVRCEPRALSNKINLILDNLRETPQIRGNILSLEKTLQQRQAMLPQLEIVLWWRQRDIERAAKRVILPRTSSLSVTKKDRAAKHCKTEASVHS